MSTTCVYTAVIGGYDELIEPDVAAASTSDFICFTDDPGLRSDVWHLRLVEPAFAHDFMSHRHDELWPSSPQRIFSIETRESQPA